MAAVVPTAFGPPILGQAAGLATPRVPTARLDATAGAVREAIAGCVFDSAVDIAVVEGERLAGVVPIERLLAARAGAAMAEIMDAEPPTVGPTTDQERAAWAMVARGDSSLAVVDRDGRFAGLVPPHRMLCVLLAEHEEDLARLGGYLAGTSASRSARSLPPRS